MRPASRLQAVSSITQGSRGAAESAPLPHEQARRESSGLGAEPHPSHPHPQPQTPHLEEDLKEVLRSEAGIELIIEDEVRPENITNRSHSKFSAICGMRIHPLIC